MSESQAGEATGSATNAKIKLTKTKDGQIDEQRNQMSKIITNPDSSFNTESSAQSPLPSTVEAASLGTD